MLRVSMPLVVLSDIHLSHRGAEAPARELARLITSHAGHDIVLAGDVFDLSVDPPARDPAESVTTLLAPHADLCAGMHAHVARGDRLVIVAGNHDATAAKPAVRQALLARLELGADAPLVTTPWFVRHGNVHIEHGHAWDPDNAPTHPLALWSYETEPLGIALTRRFLAPNGALAFAHAHETTPLEGLARTFRLFGARAPLVVARYFSTAIRLTLEAGRHASFELERVLGAEFVEPYSSHVGLDAALLHELAACRPAPTHHRFRDTFMRLYFDRIIASLLATVGGAAGLALGSAPLVGLAALSATYVAASVVKGGGRYDDGAVTRLREAAHHVAELTGAELVIFGHTHHEDEAPRYLNTGSFSFSRSGRPYVVVNDDGTAERRLLPA